MAKKIKKFFILFFCIIFIFFLIDFYKSNVKAATTPSVSYRTHVQNVGWQNYVSNGAMAGTTGKSLRLEGINIKISGIPNAKIKYQVHIQNIGWHGSQMTKWQELKGKALDLKLSRLC